MKIGHGFDVHQLVSDRALIIGGVTIPFHKGLLGHSDADVLSHAIADAIIGALGLGDIGHAFPDTDPNLRGISSQVILASIYDQMVEAGYVIGNLDATILAEKPKMAPFLEEMKANLAKVLHTDRHTINIKATTMEKMGYVGREEGIACEAVVLLKRER